MICLFWKIQIFIFVFDWSCLVFANKSRFMLLVLLKCFALIDSFVLFYFVNIGSKKDHCLKVDRAFWNKTHDPFLFVMMFFERWSFYLHLCGMLNKMAMLCGFWHSMLGQDQTFRVCFAQLSPKMAEVAISPR